MNIIVNGGTRGIGKEIVHILAREKDNRLIVTGRNEKTLDSLARQHPDLKTIRLDLLSFESHYESLMNIVNKYFEHIDILINVAGMLINKDFDKTDNSEARLMMDTNFFGPASFIKSIKPLMKAGSHIVNISSMGGFQGSTKYRGLSYYSASKAALACLTECLALEYKEDNIKVNCLALGSVQTEMLQEAFPGYKAPVSAKDMGKFIADFALNGHNIFNGKILPLAIDNP